MALSPKQERYLRALNEKADAHGIARGYVATDIARIIDTLPVDALSRQEMVGRVTRTFGKDQNAWAMSASKEELAARLSGAPAPAPRVKPEALKCAACASTLHTEERDTPNGPMLLCARCYGDSDWAQKKQAPAVPVKAESNGHASDTDTDALARTIASALASFKPGLDEAAVLDVFRREGESVLSSVAADVRSALDNIGTPTIVTVRKPDAPDVELGVAHKQLPELLDMLNAGCNVRMIGAAASGKTHAASQAAQALGMEYSAQSVCQQTTKSDLLGFVHAGGSIVRSLFRERYEHGGVFLLDEYDNGNANVLNVLNAATSNSHAAFPDIMVARHPDNLMIAAGNTRGDGADHVYVGRVQMDGALLNRFVPLRWETDWALVLALTPDQPDWVARVKLLYTALESIPVGTRPRTLITPRQADQGARLLRMGWDMDRVEQRVIWDGMSSNDATQLRAAL